jgi:hypothetical protein
MSHNQTKAVTIPYYLITKDQKAVLESKIHETMNKLHVDWRDAVDLVHAYEIDDYFTKCVMVVRAYGEEQPGCDDKESDFITLPKMAYKTGSVPTPKRKLREKILASGNPRKVSEMPFGREEYSIEECCEDGPREYMETTLLQFDNESELIGAMKLMETSGILDEFQIQVIVEGKKKEWRGIREEGKNTRFVIENAVGH